jgi:imidazolonepropionase-like amidohydrolase
MRGIVAVLACAAAVGCTSTAQAPSAAESARLAGAWVLTGTRIYTAPDVPPIDDGVVLVQGDKIVAVAPAANVRLRGDMRRSECSGGVITAGFQNSHVHFMGAAAMADDAVATALEQMLTRYGFTTVVDTGSDVADTVALRERITRGDVVGPRVLTTGWPLYPRNGIPFYLRDLPPALLAQLPQPVDAAEAIEVVRSNFARGANATKLFIATPQTGGTKRRMDPDIARAAVKESHARGGLVMAHPTDVDGVRDAVAAGVDVIVHTTIDPPKATWDHVLLRNMRAANVSVIPTLKLWTYELAKTKLPENIRQLALGDAVEQLRAFAAAGGQVLFGTDVGYMTEHDPTDEYVLMARAGLMPMQILASLTTAPAARWNESARRGKVAQGNDADLVVLNADPATDVKNFANVRCTIRAGQEIFSAPHPPAAPSPRAAERG